MCLRDSWTQFLFTLPSAVAVINGLLAGAAVALALAFTARGVAPLLTMVVGAGAGSAVLALHVAYQVHRFSRMRTTVEALFPSPLHGSGAGHRGLNRIASSSRRKSWSSSK
jgi:hypothetical protein